MVTEVQHRAWTAIAIVSGTRQVCFSVDLRSAVGPRATNAKFRRDATNISDICGCVRWRNNTLAVLSIGMACCVLNDQWDENNRGQHNSARYGSYVRDLARLA